MNPELLHRREQLLQRMTKGMTLKDVAEQMTKDVVDPYEREKQVNVIRRDWSNRSRWMMNVVRLSDGTFLTELVAGMNEAMKCCWVEYYRAKNPSAKIGALRTVILGLQNLPIFFSNPTIRKDTSLASSIYWASLYTSGCKLHQGIVTELSLQQFRCMGEQF